MARGRRQLRALITDSRTWMEERTSWKVEVVLLVILIVGLTGVIWSAFVPALAGFAVGNEAPRTITADRAVTVVDLEATNELKTRVADLVEPVYLSDSTALPAAVGDVETFFQEVDQTRQGIAGSSDTAQALVELAKVAPATLSATTLEYLLTTDDASYQLAHDRVTAALRVLFEENRIVSDSEGADSIENAKAKLRTIVDRLVTTGEAADAVYEVAASYVRQNVTEDKAQTLAKQEAAMAAVAPIMLSIDEGEAVVGEGETITAQQMLALDALGLMGARSGWKVWLGIFMVVLLEVAVFSRLVHRFNLVTKTPEYGNNMLLALVLILLGGTVIARLLMIHPLSAYTVPVAALAMVVTIILNARTGLLMVALLCFNLGLLTDFDMRYALTAFLVGAFSLYLVSKVTKRAALFGAAVVTMFVSAFTIFAVEVFTESSAGQALRACTWGLINGLLVGVLTIMLLLFLESVFNLTTPLRLLELADPAHPLLKKLLQVAPGTYNHSIMMGNLVEAAATAIGANPALARVGAYYHDIGKTVRPEYFVENQIYVGNPHDSMSPNLSRLAITAHVRDGEDLARLHNLPTPVVDIIKQHHGTSLLSYFYHKAQESSKDPVYEENYRYEGEKPQSKEAALVMLADAVEAAVRALENPTRRKIQGVIQEIIRQRVQDGQLDESALTQSDLHRVAESFDLSLLGLLGHRVRYPDQNGEAGGPSGSKARRSRSPKPLDGSSEH